jgi:hypothetical protein
VKSSEILREAARIADEDVFDGREWRCGCGAIAEAVSYGADRDRALAFFRLCAPDGVSNVKYWFGEMHLWLLGAKAHRVTALCLAAAIAESEGD